MTIKDIIINIIGNYVPIVYESNGDTIIPSGISGVDITWLCSFVLLALTLYCIFRIVGTLINGK